MIRPEQSSRWPPWDTASRFRPVFAGCSICRTAMAVGPRSVAAGESCPSTSSSPDLTAHALRAISCADSATSPRRRRRAIRQGLLYLRQAARPDGSWVPLWFGNQQAPAHANPVLGTARCSAHSNCWIPGEMKRFAACNTCCAAKRRRRLGRRRGCGFLAGRDGLGRVGIGSLLAVGCFAAGPDARHRLRDRGRRLPCESTGADRPLFFPSLVFRTALSADLVARGPRPDYSCSTTGSSTMIVDSPVPSRLTLLRLPADASRVRLSTAMHSCSSALMASSASAGVPPLDLQNRSTPQRGLFRRLVHQGRPRFPSCGVPAGRLPQGRLSPGPHAFAGTGCPLRRRSTGSSPAPCLGC